MNQTLKTFLILLPFALIGVYCNYLQLDQYAIVDIIADKYRTSFNILSWLTLNILIIAFFIPIVSLFQKIGLIKDS